MKILAVIVTYYPDLDRLKELVMTFKVEGIDTIIIDNTPIAPDFTDIYGEFICNEKNIGIAAAQNIGIIHGKKIKTNWIWFFDQDSSVSQQFIIKFIKDMQSNNNELIFAPCFLVEKKKFEYSIVDINKSGKRKKIIPSQIDGDFYTSVAISSGTLSHISVFDKVGVMDENLFIDYVDTEWCLRCFQAGLKIRIIVNAHMYHSIGDNTIEIWRFKIPIHSPQRRYYRIRNSIKLLKYRHVPKRLAYREILFSFIHQLILIIINPKRLEYSYYFIRGLIDGVKGKNGPFTK